MNTMNEITERVTCDDPRAGAFLNEVKAVVTLARNNNDPSYVARIVELPPQLSSIRGGNVEATKPGIKSACERLIEAGILRSEVRSAPKRGKKGTPHYSIVPNLDTFFQIHNRLGSGVLDMVRESNFGASVITADIYRYLSKQLEVNEELIKMLKSNLEATTFYVKNSNKALAFLLTYTRFPSTTVEESRAFDLEEAVSTLGDVVHLAFLLDVASKRFEPKGISVEAQISSSIEYGSIKIDHTSHIEIDGKTNQRS